MFRVSGFGVLGLRFEGCRVRASQVFNGFRVFVVLALRGFGASKAANP